MEIVVQCRNCDQKSLDSELCSKFDIVVKNRNSGQKSKLWSKIETVVKNINCGQNSTLRSKNFKNRNSGQKSKF